MSIIYKLYLAAKAILIGILIGLLAFAQTSVFVFPAMLMMLSCILEITENDSAKFFSEIAIIMTVIIVICGKFFEMFSWIIPYLF